MSYEKQTWAMGDVITAERLNHMEDGIKAQQSIEYNTATPTSDGLMSAADKSKLDELENNTFSGSYNDLTDKPVIPTVPEAVSSFTNDAGYQTADQVNNAINTATADLLAKTDIQIVTTADIDGMF